MTTHFIHGIAIGGVVCSIAIVLICALIRGRVI
jgi:gas vesicle protein